MLLHQSRKSSEVSPADSRHRRHVVRRGSRTHTQHAIVDTVKGVAVRSYPTELTPIVPNQTRLFTYGRLDKYSSMEQVELGAGNTKACNSSKRPLHFKNTSRSGLVSTHSTWSIQRSKPTLHYACVLGAYVLQIFALPRTIARKHSTETIRSGELLVFSTTVIQINGRALLKGAAEKRSSYAAPSPGNTRTA